MLPLESLVHILSFLADARDILPTASVSKLFNTAVQKESLWQEIAYVRYTADLAEASLQEYGGIWKRMILDDNKRCALLYVPMQQPCFYRFNRPDYFFICIITGVAFDRVQNTIRIYIDVRGESDLRDPIQSSLSDVSNENARQTVRAFEFHSDVHRAGHYLGHLEFRNPDLQSASKLYSFCYANLHHQHGDYHPHVFSFTKVLGSKTFLHRNTTSIPGTEATWTKCVPDSITRRRSSWWV